MRKCYATVLLLVTWFLMLPPPVFPPVKDADGNYRVNSSAPMSQWLTFKKLQSRDACTAELKHMAGYYRCVASNDPVLKAPSPAAAAAPSTSTATGAAKSHMQ